MPFLGGENRVFQAEAKTRKQQKKQQKKNKNKKKQKTNKIRRV